MSDTGENRKNSTNAVLYKKSVARLIACQAVCTFFDENNQNKDVDEILKNINMYYIEEEFKNKENKNCYSNLYKKNFVKKLVDYAILNTENIDNNIVKFLNNNETIETIDPMIIAIIRVAVAELSLFPEQKQNKIINEYVDITAEFFDNIYISFTNGILNNIVYGKDNSKEKHKKNANLKETKINKKTGRRILMIKANDRSS